MDINQLVNRYLKEVDFRSHHSRNGSGSEGESYDKSNVTCNKFGKKGHTNKDFRSNGNGSSGNPPKKSANEPTEWVTNKPVVSDNNDLATSTMAHNDKKYKWCTYCNNVNDAWGFHWKDGHDEWKNKQGKKSSACFPNSATNAIIYCSYLMITREYST